MALNDIIIQVVVDGQSLVSKTSGPRVVSGSASRLDNLVDVDSTGEANGAIPIYNAETDKYEVRVPTTVTGNIDGGSF